MGFDSTMNMLSTVQYVLILAFCILLISFICRRIIKDKGFEGQKNLLAFYISAILLCVSDVFWVYSYYNAGSFSEPVIRIINIFYHFMTGICTMVWLRYTDGLCFPKTVEKKLYKFFSVFPMAVLIIILVGSYYHDWIFAVDSQNQVVRGSIWNVEYFFIILYLLVSVVHSLVYAIRAKAKNDRQKGITLSLFVLGPLLAALLQIFVPHTPLICMGVTMSIVVVYLNLQGKEHLISERYKLNNLRQRAVFNALNDDFYALSIVDIDTDETLDYKTGNLFDDLLPQKGNLLDYDGHVIQFANQVVHPDDREHYISSMNKKVVLAELEEKPAYYINYRVIINGDILYCQTKIVKDTISGTGNNIIIGVHNMDDMTKKEQEYQHRLEDAVSQRTAELNIRNAELSSMSDQIIELLGYVVEARDLESGEHVHRVKDLTRILAEELMNSFPEYAMTKDKLNTIVSASAMHDLGKILIPDEILLKPGKLTKEEFEVMKTHSIKGCEILDNAPKSWNREYTKYCYQICRWHHEKYDGSGYPDGLRGEAIPVAAQLVSIADCYDALISVRRYKPPYTPDEAYNMILNGECGVFSDKMLTCLKNCKEKFEKIAEKKISEGKYE